MAASGSDIARQEEDLDDIVVDIQPVKLGELKPGDHLAVRGGYLGFKYYHHGIFIGDRDGVIDFGTTEKRKVPKKVQKVDLLEFSGRKVLARVNYPTGTCNSPEAVVSLAEEVLESPDLWGPYDLKENNCEHFAMRCKTGKHISRQVANAMRKRFKQVSLKIANAVSSSL